jgi:hypothetical protein
MLSRGFRRYMSSSTASGYRGDDIFTGGVHTFKVNADNAEIFARRVVSCIRERLMAYDPQRWSGVEISYHTNWLRPNGKVDVATCIQIHEALEKEFKIEILDTRCLVTDVSTACSIVSGDESSL